MSSTEGGNGTTARTLRLLDLLQSRPVWSGTELADRLGVTTRSVRRDVDRLRDLGYPVQRHPRRRRRLPARRRAPAAAAAARRRRGRRGGGVPAARRRRHRRGPRRGRRAHARQARPGAAGAVALAGRGDPRGHRDARRGHRRRSTPRTLLLLARACRETERVTFTYAGPRGSGERRVEPYRLVATGRRWYLLAYDLDREDWRTFRLDRMTDAGHERLALPAPRGARRGRLRAALDHRRGLRPRRPGAHRGAEDRLWSKHLPASVGTVTADGRSHCILEAGGQPPRRDGHAPRRCCRGR